MAGRIAVIAQKRTALCRQLETLRSAITEDGFDLVEARLRLDRVRTLFHAYEELHDELALLEVDREAVDQMEQISRTFYTTAAKIESANNTEHASTNSAASSFPIGNSTFLEKQRQLKLPVAELPKFDGNLENWLSFRNSFKVMVESRSDVSDLVKFMYLKNCLVGDAANKVDVYDANDASYANAWAILTDAYERKRILLSKHLDAILEIPRLTDASSSSLSKLIDTVRQHVTMLGLLEFTIPDYVIVRTLEKALPGDIRLKWEESLSLDAVPTLREFYKFIGGAIFRMQTMEREIPNNKGTRGGKRPCDHDLRGSKTKKSDSGVRALVTSPAISCFHCQGSHAIYQCPVFEGLTTQQRWDAVKAKKLCRNCLRKHSGECKSTRCKHCNRFHHSLLHTSRPTASASTNAPGPANAPTAAGATSSSNTWNNPSTAGKSA